MLNQIFILFNLEAIIKQLSIAEDEMIDDLRGLKWLSQLFLALLNVTIFKLRQTMVTKLFKLSDW